MTDEEKESFSKVSATPLFAPSPKPTAFIKREEPPKKEVRSEEDEFGDEWGGADVFKTTPSRSNLQSTQVRGNAHKDRFDDDQGSFDAPDDHQPSTPSWKAQPSVSTISTQTPSSRPPITITTPQPAPTPSNFDWNQDGDDWNDDTQPTAPENDFENLDNDFSSPPQDIRPSTPSTATRIEPQSWDWQDDSIPHEDGPEGEENDFGFDSPSLHNTAPTIPLAESNNISQHSLSSSQQALEFDPIQDSPDFNNSFDPSDASFQNPMEEGDHFFDSEEPIASDSHPTDPSGDFSNDWDDQGFDDPQQEDLPHEESFNQVEQGEEAQEEQQEYHQAPLEEAENHSSFTSSHQEPQPETEITFDGFDDVNVTPEVLGHEESIEGEKGEEDEKIVSSSPASPPAPLALSTASIPLEAHLDASSHDINDAPLHSTSHHSSSVSLTSSSTSGIHASPSSSSLTSAPFTPLGNSKTEAKEALKRLASVQFKLKEQSKLIDSLNQDKAVLLHELAKEKDTKRSLDQSVALLEKQKTDLEKKIALLEKEKSLLQQDKASSDKANTSSQSSALQSQQENHEAVVAHLTDQINRYAAMADQVKQRAEEKREKLLEVLEERKKMIEKLKRENEESLASLRREHQLALEQVKEGGLKNVMALERKLNALEEARKEVESEKEKVSHHASLHEAQVSLLQKEKEALQSQLAHSKRGEEEEAKEAWKWKEEFQRSFEASQALLQTRIDELQAQRDSIAAENATLQEHVAKVVGKREKERRDLEDQFSSLKDLLASSQANESHLQSLVSQKDEQLQVLEQEVDEEKEHLSSYRAKASSHLAILSANLLSYQQTLAQHSIPDPIASDPENAHSLQSSLQWTSTESSTTDGTQEASQTPTLARKRLSKDNKAFSSNTLLSASFATTIQHQLGELVQLIDSGAFSSLMTANVHSESSLLASGNAAPSNATVSFMELSTIKYTAQQVLTSLARVRDEGDEGQEESFNIGNAIALSPSPLLAFVASLSNMLLSSSSKLAHLRIELEDVKAQQKTAETLHASQSSSSESQLATSLSAALKEKETTVFGLEKELEDVKNELSDLRASQASTSDTLRREEEAKEQERKDAEARREERELVREEELKKLKRALAARAASAASLPELHSKISALNDQLIAKQAQVDALEADRHSYEEWASGIPGTASKPLRRASRIPPHLSGSGGATMEADPSSDYSDLPLPATSDPSSSQSSLAIELQESTGENMSGGAPATLQSILTGRGLSDAKSRILTRARTVGREMDRKLEKQEWARRVASYLPSTLRARLLLILYLCFLQIIVLYWMTSSSSCSEVSGKKDPIIE